MICHGFLQSGTAAVGSCFQVLAHNSSLSATRVALPSRGVTKLNRDRRALSPGCVGRRVATSPEVLIRKEVCVMLRELSDNECCDVSLRSLLTDARLERSM